MKKLFYIFILLFIVGWAQAQQRVVYTINDGWKFTKGSPFEAQLTGCDDSSWETVNIPGMIKMQTMKPRDSIGGRSGIENSCL